MLPLRCGVHLIGLVVLTSGALACADRRAHRRPLHAGFWFEQVTYDSPRLGTVIAEDVAVIASVARSELSDAFHGLAIVFSDRRDATYGVAVVQEVRDLRFRRPVGVAGESQAIPGLGGRGAVSFYFAASSAEAFAPAEAPRAAIIEAIGRGLGRAAVHEFTHQLLPRAPIHETTNARSYEYRSAGRREQYYGRLEWDHAWPLLEKRVGPLPIPAAAHP